MTRRMLAIKKIVGIFFFVVFIFVFIISESSAAEHAETEHFLRRKATPPIATLEEATKKKDLWYLEGYYEPDTLRLGSETGKLSEYIEKIGYISTNLHAYLWSTQMNKFGSDAELLNLGAYYNFKNSYIHYEVGFGWDDDYVYKFQNLCTLGVRVYKNLFFQTGYVFRDVQPDNMHIVYPGIVYRFGDNLINATYAASYTESRGLANQGLVRGEFALMEFLKLSTGIAFGERLFDASGLKASLENGFSLFVVLDTAIFKHFNLKVGYTYGRENPDFIRSGMNFALSTKF